MQRNYYDITSVYEFTYIKVGKMETMKFVYYNEDNKWVGWLEEYPDNRSLGETLEELKENLKSIYSDLNSGEIPNVRRYGELIVG